MISHQLRFLPTFVLLASIGCSPVWERVPRDATSNDAQSSTAANDDTLVQFSLLAALAAGDYGDGAPLRDVLASGDFGIGTFDRLDGEMIVLDGKIYQAQSDGSIRPADLSGSTPFAAVTKFSADGQFENLSATSLEELDKQLDDRLPRRNLPYALRLEGEFSVLTLRSVPAQTPPFQPLVDVVKHQSTWQHKNVRGTLVGLRCPAWVGTLNVSGYHWHFLSNDRHLGGHVLGCEFQNGALQFDECTTLVIHLPQTKQFDRFDVRAIDDKDINVIERQRTDVPR